MCHSLKNNTKINNVHKRCLQLIFSDERSPYEELLEKNGSVSIHHRNIQEHLKRKLTKSKMNYHLRFSVTYFIKQKWIPRKCVPADCVRAAYLAPVLLKTFFSKYVLLLFILMISYTPICSDGPEMVVFNGFFFVLQ